MNERIKKLRKELNWTQEKFGGKIGIKKNTLSQIENGVNGVTDQVIASILNADWDGRRVNEEWLRNGTGEMFKVEDRNSAIARMTKMLLDEEEDSFKNRLIAVLSGLTEDQWEVLAQIADELAKKKTDG